MVMWVAVAHAFSPLYEFPQCIHFLASVYLACVQDFGCK